MRRGRKSSHSASGIVPSAPLSYDDQVLAWRKNLTETDCRSLASDYLRGIKQPDTHDAYDEYQERWGEAESNRAASRDKKKARQSRYA